MKRKTVFRQWLRIVLGLLVFALGVHLTIFANIGLAPWDCLGMGIAKHTPLNYGLSMTVMARPVHSGVCQCGRSHILTMSIRHPAYR